MVKTLPSFSLFSVTQKKHVTLWAEGESWVGSYQCSVSISWSRSLPVNGDHGSPHSSAADKGFQTLPVPQN